MADQEVGRAQIVIEADVAKLHSEVAKASSSLSAFQQKAASDAQRTADAQATAAKYAADTITEQGRKVLAARAQDRQSMQDMNTLQRAITSGAIDEAEGTAAVTAALQRQLAARNEIRAAMATQQGYSQQMAASAAVRTLDSGNPGIRSIERFIDLSPAVASAVSALFPIIGAAGLTGLLLHMGEEGYKAFKKVQDAAKDTTRDFQALDDQARVVSDDLDINNQRLQDQIGKLSGHPGNGLALAIFEAKKMADQLVVSLDKAGKERDAVLAKHDTGTLGGIMSFFNLGPAPTKTQAEQIKADGEKLADAVREANDRFDVALLSTADPKAKQAALKKRNDEVHTQFQSQIDAYLTEIGNLRSRQVQSAQDAASAAAHPGVGMLPMVAYKVDNSAKIANLQGVIKSLQRQLHDETADESIYAGSVTIGGMKGAGEADEARRKAAEKQMKGMQQDLAALKISFQGDHASMVTAELNFWEQMLAPASKYEQNKAAVQEKIVSAQQAFDAELNSINAKAVADQKRLAEARKQDASDFAAVLRQWNQGLLTLSEANANATEQAARNSVAIREQALAHDEAYGAVSRHDAAIELATLHARDYAAQLERLNEQQAAIDADAELTDDERKAKTKNLNTQKDALNTQASMTAQKDAWSVEMTTAAGGVAQAFGEITASGRDTAAMMKTLVGTTFSSLNKTILDTLNTPGWQHKGAWSSFGKGVATDVEGAGLRKAESMIPGLSKLGSRTNPMWTKSADFTGSVVSRSGSAFTSPGVMAGIMSLLPHFAGGGDVAAGTMAMVGENGPEPVMFGSNAHVFPNKSMSSMSGSGGDTHYHIDARGSTDPAQTAAMVQKAIMQARPMLRRDAAHAMDEREVEGKIQLHGGNANGRRE